MDCLQSLIECIDNKDIPENVREDLLKIYDVFLMLVETSCELRKNQRKTED